MFGAMRGLWTIKMMPYILIKIEGYIKEV